MVEAKAGATNDSARRSSGATQPKSGNAGPRPPSLEEMPFENPVELRSAVKPKAAQPVAAQIHLLNFERSPKDPSWGVLPGALPSEGLSVARVKRTARTAPDGTCGVGTKEGLGSPDVFAALR